MVSLDELKQISDMSALDRSFYMKLEEAKKVALTTSQRSIELNVMKRSFFTDQLAQFVKGPINPDELYQSQFDLVNYAHPKGCELVMLPMLPWQAYSTIGRLTDALPSRFSECRLAAS